MQRFWHSITTRFSLFAIGFLALAALLASCAVIFQWPLVWIVPPLALVLLAASAVWWLQRRRRQRDAASFGGMLEQQTAGATPKAGPTQREETEAIRKRMLEAIGTIKTSKLGQLSGDAALYELPWYMIIGNPAAGKSTAIANSGLQFPFADSKIVQGIGGTRNCDWFFTTDGILLDTAGRYSVNDEDRAEWFGFLSLLKKHRKRAPINGIIIAVSIAELTGSRPEFAINLAKNLRQRVQELTEKLEVHAPVYVVFTKADLITGFNEFFQDTERGERDRVWGATLPYSQTSSRQDVLEQFDQRFDELYDGLKELSLASMALQQNERMPPGVFTFPLEFSAIKGSLRAFIATLFEENPFQFQPVFRGFYFTSALQEGEPVSASSQQVARRFDLAFAPAPAAAPSGARQHGYFLLELFRKVIFADKHLVANYANRAKLRFKYAVFFAATVSLGACLGGWSWSYLGNRQLVANVEADLNKVVKLQERRLDLQSRLEALEILQDRIEQLEAYRTQRPWSLRLGLYQGDLLERKLREEYFAGARQVMLAPVAGALEALLFEMNASADQLQPTARTPQTPAPASPTAAPRGVQYQAASATNVEDAYKALKT
ncbi:MAG: type VI secretion system membrane subunit TssM, partial [Janthinobacterium sp.]